MFVDRILFLIILVRSLCRYPYNNFLHHHVENIILSCLESKNVPLIANLLRECNLLGKILEAEKNCMLGSDPNMVVILS